MRTALPASQADQHLKRAGRSKARHQGSRRGHLARQLHALRSRILRPGAENPATSRQPVRHEVVTHVFRYDLSPMCPGWTRLSWGAGQDKTAKTYVIEIAI